MQGTVADAHFRKHSSLSSCGGEHCYDALCFQVIDTDDELAEPTEADQAEDRMEAKLFAVLFKKEPVMPAVEVRISISKMPMNT